MHQTRTHIHGCALVKAALSTGNAERPGGCKHDAKPVLCVWGRPDAAVNRHITPGVGISCICTAVPAGTWPGGSYPQQVTYCPHYQYQYLLPANAC